MKDAGFTAYCGNSCCRHDRTCCKGGDDMATGTSGVGS